MKSKHFFIILFLILPGCSQELKSQSHFMGTGDFKRSIDLSSRHSVNTPYSFGIYWQFSPEMALSAYAAPPDDHVIFQTTNDCKKHHGPERIGYNIATNGNMYFSLALTIAEPSRNGQSRFRPEHQVELSYKLINKKVRHYINYCQGALNTIEFSNRNEIFCLNYKFQVKLHPEDAPFTVAPFISAGLSYYSYSNIYPTNNLPYGFIQNEEIIKPQLDIGISFRLHIFAY
jgi:hypothetical protein